MAVMLVDIRLLFNSLQSARGFVCLVWLCHALLASGMSSLASAPSSPFPTETTPTTTTASIISPTPQTSIMMAPISMFTSASVLQTSALTSVSADASSVASLPQFSVGLETAVGIAPASTATAMTSIAPSASQQTIFLSVSSIGPLSSSSISPMLLMTSSVLAVQTSALAPEASPIVPREIIIRENTIQVTLPSYNLQNFTERVREQFRNLTAEVINSYCSEEASACTFVQIQLRRRRAAVTVELSDVVISDVVENSNGVVQFNLYVLVSSAGGEILQLQALQESIETNSEAYSTEGFGELILGPVGVDSPTTGMQPTTPSSGLQGDTIYVIVAIAILYTIVMALFMISVLIAYKQKNKRKQIAWRMEQSDMSAINVLANRNAHFQ